MKKYVLDSYALISYIEGEYTGRPVAEIFKKALRLEAELLVCVINWGEVCCTAFRDGGKPNAEFYRHSVAKFPITVLEANKELTVQAATLKAKHKMSYADCFAAGLAKLQKAVLVTGDSEFKQVENEIKLLWLARSS